MYDKCIVAHRKYRPHQRVNGRSTTLARVIVAEQEGLDITDREWVARHTCNDPYCLNPAHLVSGSYSDNRKDQIEHGTFGWLIDQEKAEAIRSASGVMRDIADAFGVSTSTVHRIKTGKSWEHLT